jgi:hypothetical protein
MSFGHGHVVYPSSQRFLWIFFSPDTKIPNDKALMIYQLECVAHPSSFPLEGGYFPLKEDKERT